MRAHHPIITRSLVLIALLLCVLGSSPRRVRAQNQAEDLINQAAKLFDAGDYEEAELAALRALTDEDQLLDVDRARLHRLLGFIYVVLEEKEKAKQQFINWLEIDPFARLDPLYISPKIISVFEEAKAEFQVRQEQGKPPDYTQLNRQLHALKRSVLFPGLGQIYQDQQVKGFTLLAAEIVCLGGFAYFQVNYDRARDDYLQETDPEKMQDRYDDYNFFYRGRTASMLLAVGVYLYSLADVLYFPPKEPESSSVSFNLTPRGGALITLTLPLP